MKLPRLAAVFAAAAALFGGIAAPAAAQGQFDKPKYASIVVDANSGEVLYALHADDARYPASITKIMTLYLTFEALATGRLSMDDRVPFSAHASSQAPSKLGVPAGEDISVSEAIQAAAVMSANDAAVALAERISGGSEQRFAALMTLRGQELGMKRTRFQNANGLPEAHRGDVNVSTARDIAVLSRAVMRDYPQYYHFFNQHAFTWRGRTTLNHNRLLLRMPGMDGLKTGYTNAAGFNLAASAVHDGRRLITVVLGGSSSAARNENVETLLQAGFDVLDRRSHGQPLTLASLLSEPEDGGGMIVRPPLEMGSADQAGLQVVTADAPPPPPARPFQMARLDAPPPTARFAPPRPVAAARAASPRVAEVCDDITVRRHGRRVREARCHAASASEVLASAPDCHGLSGSSLRACRADVNEAHAVARTAAPEAADCAGLHGRMLKACRSDAKHAETQVAETAPTAADCAKVRGRHARAACRKDEQAGAVETARAEPTAPDCAKAHGRHARAACKTAASEDEAPAKTTKTEGGAYMIQVGAFGSRSDAQAHLAKLAGVVGGSEKVESAGHTYRARFAGLSKADARAACARLSAKGERCMVVAR